MDTSNSGRLSASQLHIISHINRSIWKQASLKQPPYPPIFMPLVMPVPPIGVGLSSIFIDSDHLHLLPGRHKVVEKLGQ